MSIRRRMVEKKYRRDAEKGDPVAQFKLGHAGYLDAKKTKKANAYAEAVVWIRRAAAQNYAVALAHLGYMHFFGNGVPKDLAESKSWFRKAAEQGDPHYQYTYSAMCWNGDFGVKDVKEAEIWMLKAADQGMAEAHWALGNFHSDFLRSTSAQDRIQGYMWHTLAALQDEPGHSAEAARTMRDRIAENMTAEQVAEAEDRVQIWLQEHADVMGEDLVTHWRSRIADPLKPLTPEEAKKEKARLEALMDWVRKGLDGSDHDP